MNYEKCLNLALEWRRSDVAADIVKMPGFNVEMHRTILPKAIDVAIRENQVDFVQLLIDSGVDLDEYKNCAKLTELYKYSVYISSDQLTFSTYFRIRKTVIGKK